MIRTLSLSADLGAPAVIAACALAALGVGLLAIELFRAHRPRGVSVRVALSGALAALGLLAAVLRPVSVVSTGTLVGPKVVVLADASRSIDLPGLDGTRRQSLERALAELQKRGSEVRLSLYSFGIGPAEPVAPLAVGVSPTFRVKPVLGSDLAAALESVARAADERPAAIVVLSDGRLDRPGEVAPGDATRAALGQLAIPVHTVGLAEAAPRDASIRRVLAAGAAVAHQPFSLRIEIGCAGGLSCGDIPVIARELRDQGQPVMLASGVAHVVEGKATVELSMTVERAGARILEISIQPPEGDEIPENNRRYVSVDVTRDRVRVLHVAGRPTYDVRALRMWLKSDASVDVVAFFILRTHDSQVQASSDELALIPFPVDELFTEQLPTFDAVVLQDFNAKPYGLDKHLKNLARYVKDGGGLIMVGGQGSFIGGHYADTALADVLPVEDVMLPLIKDAPVLGHYVQSDTIRCGASGRGLPVRGSGLCSALLAAGVAAPAAAGGTAAVGVAGAALVRAGGSRAAASARRGGGYGVEHDAAAGGRDARLVQSAVQVGLIAHQGLEGSGLLGGDLDACRAGFAAADLHLDATEFGRMQAQRHLPAAIRGLSERQQRRGDLRRRGGGGGWRAGCGRRRGGGRCHGGRCRDRWRKQRGGGNRGSVRRLRPGGGSRPLDCRWEPFLHGFDGGSRIRPIGGSRRVANGGRR